MSHLFPNLITTSLIFLWSQQNDSERFYVCKALREKEEQEREKEKIK